MKKQIHLQPTPGGQGLAVRVNDHDCCDLLLIGPAPTDERILGGDDEEFVVGHLLSGLERALAPDVRPGQNFFVLLITTYTSGFFERSGDTIQLRFKADKGQLIADLAVPVPLAEQWQEQLRTFRQANP